MINKMMFQTSDENCISTGKEREDRQRQSKERFDPLQLNVKCPDTAVLLLGSRERPVLLAAAAALTKYAAKGKDHLQTLFNLDIVDNLLPLFDNEDLCTRRFAMRLLAEMSAMPFVRNHLLESEAILPRFLDTLANDTDTFVQEYLSVILAEISKEPYGVVKLVELCSSFDFIFDNIQHTDPDIKKNNIELMNNLLADSVVMDNISSSQAFSFPLIYNLLEEPYPAIQTLALSAVESLVARTKDEHIQKLFQESGGLKLLLELLENVEWANLHPYILKILKQAAVSSKTMESLSLNGGLATLFKYVESTATPTDFRDGLDVLVRLASTQSGRKALYDFGVTSLLLKNLRSSHDPELNRITCHGIGMMSRYPPAAEDIAIDNPMKLILDILKDDNTTSEAGKAAAFAIKELCTSNRKNCLNFLEVKGQMYLESLLKQAVEKVSLEILSTALDVLTVIGRYPDLRESLVEVGLVGALCSPLEATATKAKDRAADELKIGCCEVLAKFCVEKRMRQLCLGQSVPERLFALLRGSESTPVRAAAVKLVQQLCEDRLVAERFVKIGYLNYLMKNRTASNVVPAWNTCIETLFSAHLPVKFAATGRLSLRDVTMNGFYVMRRYTCPFPVLDELFALKMCPMEPIYVVNFAESREGLPDEGSSLSSQESTDFEATSAWLDVRFGRLQPDPDLCEYLQLFKCILKANEDNETGKVFASTVIDISKIASRAKLLGKFVARQLSGPDPKYPCVDHQLDIHVREIRDAIETSVLPLGQLRVGSYLERALLFKVMADRICLPAALVRGDYGKAWIEIAIPEIEDSVQRFLPSSHPGVFENGASTKRESTMKRGSKSFESIYTSKPNQQEEPDGVRVARDNLRTVLPARLLSENYIVDLVDNPGDLIPIKSARARAYCSPVSRCIAICDV